jgi:hypothetical protein
MADIASLIVEVKSEGIKKTIDELYNLKNNANKAEEATEGLKKEQEKLKRQANEGAKAQGALAKQSNVVRGNFQLMKGATQQVSYQLQDIAVQAQMGTNAFVILGQQGPQLASVFGPGGAVLGAFIALGAMVGGTLVAAFTGAEGGSDELEKALERLEGQISRTENGTLELSKRIAELGKISAAAAAAEIISAMSDARRSLRETKNEVDLLVGSIGYIDFDTISSELERLKRQGITSEDILGESGSYTGQAGTIGVALDEIANRFGLVGEAGREQALGLVEAISSLDRQDVTTYEDLQGVIDGIASSQRELNVPFAEFRRGLLTEIKQIKDLTDTTVFLGQARRDLNREGVSALTPITEGAEEEAEDANDAAIKAAEDARDRLKQIRFNSLNDQQKIWAAEKEAATQLLLDKQAGLIGEGEYEQARIELRQTAEQKITEIVSREAKAQEAAKTAAALKAEMEQKKIDDARIESQQNVTNSLLMAEDVLLQGKSESVKAAARIGINLANQEKRENATKIISDSYAAAMGAYKALAGIPVIGPALGAAAAGTILAAGTAYATQSLAGRALGGQVRGGESYLVGERGPELLTMGGSGRVSSNDQLKKAMGGGESIQIVNNVDARGSGADVDMKIRSAMQQTSQQTVATIQDLMRRRRFV